MEDKDIMRSGISLLHTKCERCGNAPMSILRVMTPDGRLILVLFCSRCGFPIIRKEYRK